MKLPKHPLLIVFAAVAIAFVAALAMRDTKTYRITTHTPGGEIISTYYSRGRPSLSDGVYRFTTAKGAQEQVPAAYTRVTSDITSSDRGGMFTNF